MPTYTHQAQSCQPPIANYWGEAPSVLILPLKSWDVQTSPWRMQFVTSFSVWLFAPISKLRTISKLMTSQCVAYMPKNNSRFCWLALIALQVCVLEHGVSFRKFSGFPQYETRVQLLLLLLALSYTILECHQTDSKFTLKTMMFVMFAKTEGPG